MFKRIEDNKGQALTEFVFVLPILFLLFLIIVQFSVVIERHLNTQKALWLSLRGYSLLKYTVVQPWSRYSRSELKNMVAEHFFTRKDEVDVSFSEYVGGVKATITCKTPFLYNGLSWQPIWDVFGGVVRGGKIEVTSKGWILKSPMATK